MRIVISSREYPVEDGTLALGGTSVPIRDGCAEAAVEAPEAFWAVLRDFTVVRIRDQVRFRVSRFDAGWLNVTAEDLAVGAAMVRVDPEAGAVRISVPFPNARVSLVNTERSRDFRADQSGVLVLFEDLSQYRVTVPDHPESVVTMKTL